MLDAPVFGACGADEESAFLETGDDTRDVGRIAAERIGDGAHGERLVEREQHTSLDGREVMSLRDGFEMRAKTLDVDEEEFDHFGAGRGGGVGRLWDAA